MHSTNIGRHGTFPVHLLLALLVGPLLVREVAHQELLPWPPLALQTPKRKQSLATACEAQQIDEQTVASYFEERNEGKFIENLRLQTTCFFTTSYTISRNATVRKKLPIQVDKT